MPVQTEHRFPLDLSVLDAVGSRVTLADLRGQARGGGRVPHAHRLGRRRAIPAGDRPAHRRIRRPTMQAATGSKALTVLPQCAAKG